MRSDADMQQDNAVAAEAHSPEHADEKHPAVTQQDADAASVETAQPKAQAGVQKAIALKKAWSKRTLIVAFSRYADSAIFCALCKLTGLNRL